MARIMYFPWWQHTVHVQLSSSVKDYYDPIWIDGTWPYNEGEIHWQTTKQLNEGFECFEWTSIENSWLVLEAEATIVVLFIDIYWFTAKQELSN